MRVLAGQLILLATLSAACGGPPVDLTKGLEIVDVSTGWYDAAPSTARTKLVPRYFNLKNVSDQPLAAAAAQRGVPAGRPKDEWGTVWVP